MCSKISSTVKLMQNSKKTYKPRPQRIQKTMHWFTLYKIVTKSTDFLTISALITIFNIPCVKLIFTWGVSVKYFALQTLLAGIWCAFIWNDIYKVLVRIGKEISRFPFEITCWSLTNSFDFSPVKLSTCCLSYFYVFII